MRPFRLSFKLCLGMRLSFLNAKHMLMWCSSSQSADRKHAWPNNSLHNATEGKEAPRKKRRLQGALYPIMNMPLDVLFEVSAYEFPRRDELNVFIKILSYLSPENVLRMARTNKNMRNLLMSKAQKHIWNAAEKAVRLPACPPDLSSPQYASLVYDTFCMVRNLIAVPASLLIYNLDRIVSPPTRKSLTFIRDPDFAKRVTQMSKD